MKKAETTQTKAYKLGRIRHIQRFPVWENYAGSGAVQRTDTDDFAQLKD